MLAPVPKKRSDGGSSFATLGKYLTVVIDADTGEVVSRGEVMISPALLSAETAAAEMKAVAAENPRCKDAVMHAVLAWKKGERPTTEQWQSAVKHVMDSLKDRDGVSIGDHQYMAVAHDDTESFHVHIMANRVHPETYRANSPEWLHKTLDKACREIEATQGWQHSNGLYKWDEDKGKAVAMTREEREQLREETQESGVKRGTAGTGKASKMETYGDAESLETYCKGRPAKDLDQLMKRDGINWQDVHSSLMKHGLLLHKGEKGGYTVSAEGANGERIHVKASKVFRSQFAGKAQRAGTEEKLGPWEAPKESLQHVVKEQQYNEHRAPKRNPQERAERREERAQARAELKNRYTDYKAQFKPVKAINLYAHKQKLASVTAQRKLELASIATSGLSPADKQAQRSQANFKSAKAKELLKAELNAARQALKEDPANKRKSYQEWVADRAQEGDVAAIAQLRGFVYSDKKKIKALELDEAALESEDGFAGAIKLKRVAPLLPKSRLDQITTQVDRRTGDVHYLLGRNRLFTDRGKHVVFNPVGAASDEAIAAGLLLAKEKFGDKLTINGSDEFKKRVIAVIIKNKIQVRFADQMLNSMHQEALDELPVPSLASVPPKANRPYPGVILQEDAHYIYQDAGRGVVVRHLKSDVAAKTRVMPALGEMFVMHYDANGKLSTAIPSKGGGRGSGR